MKLTPALQFAGLLHVGLIAAGVLMPRAVNLRTNLTSLPAFVRRLFWVYYVFVGLSLVSFGAASFFLADALASGTVLARAVCGFLATFWTIRLFAAAFVFDVRPYLRNALWKTGYNATNVAFAILPVIYGWAVFAGGKP